MFAVLAKVCSRGHTDLNHGPIGLQPIALPLSYIPKAVTPEQLLNADAILEYLLFTEVILEHSLSND